MVLDIEVDARKVRKRFCDPFEKEHKIIMLQKKEPNSPPRLLYNADGIDRNIPLKLPEGGIIVGQNIKFDLLYLWENESLQSWIMEGGKIWDTSLAEFFLEGQNKNLKYHLTNLSVKYGGTPKLDVVKAHFDAGRLFSELDYDLAMEYGAKDVLDTEHVYICQQARAREYDMMGILQVHMDHLLAICEIEANGLYLDTDLIGIKAKEQERKVQQCVEQLEAIVTKETDWPSDKVDFSSRSNDHVSAVLFGGLVTYDTIIENPTPKGEKFYRSGNKKGELRTKKCVEFIDIDGYKLPKTAETKKEGYYETGNKALGHIDHPFVKELLNYRKEFKLLSTYFMGYPPLINPYTGCIHSEFKGNGTATGRMASRNPNVQNLHPEMLECFTSRFPNGTICELDFSQLEVCIAAWIFNDSLLTLEVNNNVDLHYQNAKLLFCKDDISSKERKLAKFLTFGLLYGQGAKTMSIVHDIDAEIAARFIDVFYNKYVDIAYAHTQLQQEVKNNAIGDTSFLTTPLGRRYFLQKYDSNWGKKFSPTEQKNYKIQGTASDVVATAIGRVYRYLIKYRNYVKMINEVHDSLILDCHPECTEAIISEVKIIMEESSKILTKRLGIPVNIPLKVDVSSGGSWKDCK